MKVCSAVASDIPAIAEVHVRSWQETYVGQVPQDLLDGLSVEDRIRTWRNWMADREWPNPDLLVLVDDADDVVGFASTSRSRDADANACTGEIPAIYTRAVVWDRGWGRALMETALRRLAQAGFLDATLWVLATNERARRFYEAGGWRWDGSTKPHVIGGQEVTELRYRVVLE